MARSATAANENANNQYGDYEKQAVGNYNSQMQGFNTQLNGMSANDPWQSKSYLQNQGKLASAGMNAADQAAKQQLQSTAMRTGTNTAALAGTTASIARAGQRQNDAFNAQTATENTDKSAAYQHQLLQDRLAGANSEAGMYGTSTSGRSNALGNLTSMQNAQDAMWGQIAAGAMQGAGTGMGAAFK